eukprot:Hpha_TRINITY_DN2577_c0_g1::TRINITY_DN2577_c0_g1_i1::g.1466::m.1466
MWFAVLSAAVAAAAGEFKLTLRQSYLSGLVAGRNGRQEWLPNDTAVTWAAPRSAVVVVDMWDKHWCPTATLRVGELVPPMNALLSAWRAEGGTVIFAPSEVWGFYDGTRVRNNTLSLPNATVPPANPLPVPKVPVLTITDGGCDVEAKIANVWTRQNAGLEIKDSDFMIASAEGQAEQELTNILAAKGIDRLLYVGVHENICILTRPFAIEKLRAWGWTPDRIGVVRELTDLMYTPRDPPYVAHAEGLSLMHGYIEKFWASTVSMYDVLAPFYSRD